MQRYGYGIAIIEPSKRNKGQQHQNSSRKPKTRDRKNIRYAQGNLKNKDENNMYALQKVAIKMAPHILTHPELIPVALVIGAAAMIYDANN